ncbi:MAG TPA: GNAT family N-acetyltransferase [Myxococcota bacterium]
MFQARERLVTRGKTGRTLKRPRKVIEPGAAPGAVAFIDYQEYGPAEEPYVYIQYMLVRDDMRGRGYGKTLLKHFMRDAEARGVSLVHFGKIMNPQMWKLYEKWRKKHDEGKYAPEVVGKARF